MNGLETRKGTILLRPQPRRSDAVAALLGFLLGSLAGISFFPYGFELKSDGVLIAFLGGGVVGGLASAAVARVLVRKVGNLGAVAVGAVLSFAVGWTASSQSAAIGSWFRGLAPGYEVAPALWGGAATAAGGSLFLLILWSSVSEAVPPGAIGNLTARTMGRTFIVEGAVLGALLGALGGSLSAAFVQLSKGEYGLAQTSIPGRALLASWIGALTGAMVLALGVWVRRRKLKDDRIPGHQRDLQEAP